MSESNKFNSLDDQIDDNDFIIRIRPHIDKEKRWSGEIDVSIINLSQNDLDNEDFNAMMYLSKLVAASIPAMDENDSIRVAMQDVLEDYESAGNIDEEEMMDFDVDISDEGDNVVRLTFNSKTQGSA